MPRLSLVGCALAFVLIAMAAACGRSPVTRSPASPLAPGVASVLQLSGPPSIAPGQSAQFTATIRLTDGTVKSATTGQNIRWTTTNSSLLQVSSSGVVTAGQKAYGIRGTGKAEPKK